MNSPRTMAEETRGGPRNGLTRCPHAPCSEASGSPRRETHASVPYAVLVTICAKCGSENPRRANFCLQCGAALAQAQRAPDQRKTVTIVFADVTGSTALGERLDAEARRGILNRYFGRDESGARAPPCKSQEADARTRTEDPFITSSGRLSPPVTSSHLRSFPARRLPDSR
jgi:hypothetical protein